MDHNPHALAFAHLRKHWVQASRISPLLSESALQAAIDAGIAEARTTEAGFEARLAPNYSAHAVLSTWVTPAEALVLRAHAQAQGMSISETLRTALRACGLLG